ncbi:MAG: Maf family protein [Armatimonadetes bacterium]|nr:Maf family protein [Armatimonadota bacterium]MDW8027708.1 Maf family protein [Armatimonadota bacterium]
MKRSKKVRLILVSASPRRQELLKQIGVQFEVCPSQIDENLPKQVDEPERLAVELARSKILAASKNLPNSWLIAADTIVVAGRKPLGKPKSEKEAKKMLKQLSGRTHLVVTGICLALTNSKGEIVRCHEGVEKTFVTFRKINDEEIDAYVATGEPMDKAGSYGIQGKAAIFVVKIVGCYFNVVGLPLAKLATLMKEAGIEVTKLWNVEANNDEF